MNATEKLNVGIVGATGMVGEVFLDLLNKRNFPVKSLKLFASPSSAGKKIPFGGREYILEVLQDGCFRGLDLVFFSSGDSISQTWAPKAVQDGAFAIDNSGAFRMNPEYALVVPEINGHLLPNSDSPALISNPNCSTIQMVLALEPLRKQFGLKEVRVATYQAVSGAGKEAKQELLTQSQEALNSTNTGATGAATAASTTVTTPPQAFPHTMAFNCIPQIGSFDPSGFSSEEVKMIKETKKILKLPDLYLSAFAVRVPVLNAHSEALWVTLDQEVNSKADIVECLRAAPGLTVSEPTEGQPNDDLNYPHALQTSGEDQVFVGRIHQDWENPKTWLMWVVGDNLLKGAALNGIQIAEHIYKTM